MSLERDRINICLGTDSGMYTIVVERKLDSKKRFFGLCESCYWTATILREIENYECPVCKRQKVALMPLGNDEQYDYSLETTQELKLKFSLLSRLMGKMAVFICNEPTFHRNQPTSILSH